MTTTGAATLGDLLELADSGTWGDEGSSTNGQLVLRSTNIVDYQIDLSEVAHRTIPAGHIQSKRLEPGDIVVTSSSGSPDHIGKCAVFEPKGVRNPFYFSNFTLRLRTIPSKLDPYYLYHWLKSARGRAILVGQSSTTTGLRNLNKKIYLAQRLPVPPLPEQRRIAALLDRAEAVRRKREESRRLVDELLRSVFLEMFGDPVRNEKGWEVVRLSDVSQRIQIGPFGSLLHDSDYVDGGVPLINPMHIKDGWIIVDSHRTVTQQKAESLESYRVISGEVILGRRGEMGRCAIVNPDQSGYLCGTGSIVIRPFDDLLLPEYLQMTLASAAIRGYLEKATRGATMPNLNRAIVADLPIILPPIAEQRRFTLQRARLLSCRERHEVLLQELENFSTMLSAQLLSVE